MAAIRHGAAWLLGLAVLTAVSYGHIVVLAAALSALTGGR